MDEASTLQEIEKELFPEQRSQKEFVWKNLVIGVAVVIIVTFFIYLGVSQSIKSSAYKPMNLSTKSQNSGSVAGASTYGPPEKPSGAIVPTKKPTSSPTSEPTATPTSAPTSAPEATETPTPQPTETPVPTATSTPSDTPTPTATDTPTPTPTGQP